MIKTEVNNNDVTVENRRDSESIMATGELKAILTKLGRYNNENIKIKVNKVTKELLNILEEEQYIEVLACEKEEATIKSKQNTKSFSLPQTINARRHELLQWATFFLPTVTGTLIVFTRMGVKTHHEAVQSGIGGQIIGLIY